MDNIILIIPTYEPDEKLIKTVRAMHAEGFEKILLVNDGSGPAYDCIFDRLSQEFPNDTILSHEKNLGKGRALKTAFSYVNENLKGILGAVTADGDGQHEAGDVMRVAKRLSENNDSVIIGCRDFENAQVPGKSKAGHGLVSGILGRLFNISASDSQSGLRGIPFKYLEKFATEIEGERFEYETVMFIYMKNEGIPFEEIKIKAVYEDGNKSTHYRALADPLRVGRSIFRQVPIAKQLLSSLVCAVVDIGLFRLFDAVLPENESNTAVHLFFATAIARVISAVLNYSINRLYVFRSRAGVASSFVKYAMLAAVQMTLSWLGTTGVTMLTGATGLPRTLLKFSVDICLFFLSYFVQKKWVFKSRRT